MMDVAVSLDWSFLLFCMNVLDGFMQEPVPSPFCPKISPPSEFYLDGYQPFGTWTRDSLVETLRDNCYSRAIFLHQEP